jgi:uncharacterized protein (DUF2235 family)
MSSNAQTGLNADSGNTARPDAAKEPRQLVILCDGTSNSLDVRVGTNVARLFAALGQEGLNQKIFYDPGVGSASYAPSTTLLDFVLQKFDRIMGLAFGRGVFENVSQAYEFLMREYKAGDQVFILGFSRGAFTVRSVVGLVNAFGLLPASSTNLIPTLMDVYFSRREPDLLSRISQKVMRWKKGADRDALVGKVKKECVPTDRQKIPIFFVGVWDTVATVGIPPLDKQIPVLAKMKNNDGSAKCFQHVRQALALDEHRFMFLPRPYETQDIDLREASDPLRSTEQSLLQRWFPGAHCDVGGTYGDNSHTSQAALQWMVSEAKALKLRVQYPKKIDLEHNAKASLNVLLHSELYDVPWWAVAGMQVRDTSSRVGALATMSKENQNLRYPQDTVWKKRRSVFWLVFSIVVFALCWWQSGLAVGMFTGWTACTTHWGWHPVQMAHWQLMAVCSSCEFFPKPLTGSAIKTALAWDFVMIGAYAYFLGRLCSRAFASLVGIHSIGKPKRWFLNALGMGLMWLVLGDVLENVFTLLWQGWLDDKWAWGWLEWFNRLVITIFSFMKLTGLGMCVMLLAWSFTSWLKRVLFVRH